VTGSPTGTSLSDVERRTVARFVELLESELGEELRSVWLFGSRARGEPGNADSDVDLMVVTQNGKRDFSLVQELAFRAAETEGYPWLCLAAHVRDPHHVAYKRSIDDFFMQEVDRDKIVLAGEP